MWKYQNTDDMYIGRFSDNNELYHYGIPGMKWGHKKAILYQPNGIKKRQQKSDNQSSKKQLSKKQARRKALKIGAAVAGGALAAYGAYKLSKVATKKIREIGYNKYKESKYKDSDKTYKKAINRLNDEIKFAKNNKNYKKGYGEVVGKYGKYAYNVTNNGRTYGLKYIDTKEAPTSTKELAKYAFRRRSKL